MTSRSLEANMTSSIPLIVVSIILLGAGRLTGAGEDDSTFIFVDLNETQARTLPTKIISKPQSTCPVTGKPIDKKCYVDYKGKRIYVCGSGCVSIVKKNPKKYLEKLAASGQGVETVLFPDEGGKPNKKPGPRPDAPAAK
jgi:hypothetical protein